ncbi:unnamed protein product [Phytomonas sp. EM1]|nr:unnamed protein product [Phytomonas sp. EM1]|eukprot:CCW64112.1 unnamed protein product [Phytomonas sp. isolate EM1]
MRLSRRFLALPLRCFHRFTTAPSHLLRGGLLPASPSFPNPRCFSSPSGGDVHSEVEEPLLSTPDEVEAAFRGSVAARTVGNAYLRRYLQRLPPKDHTLGVAAMTGARGSGLVLTAPTYEALLELLIRAGQLRASLELHQEMLQRRLAPTAHAYALLMQLCLQRGMARECQSLFKDMQRRGVKPSSENYELMIKALAAENPPQWELAIKIFDKLSRERNSPSINAKTYNALMTVYVNMEPFDWRVVYNCYHEMRSRTPRIPLEWESYLILRGALLKGKAGYVRRFLTFFDAWVATTELASLGFLKGLLVYFAVMWVIKSIFGYLFVLYLESMGTPKTSGPGESILPP